MWCPQCKNEFVNGITVCPKCGIDLVETLEENEAAEPKVSSSRVYGIKAVYDEEATKSFYAAMDERFGDKVTDSGYSTKNATEDEAEVLQKMKEASDEVQKQSKTKVVYQNSNDKAEEVKGSAYSLLFVGIVGIVFLILLYTGVLPIQLSFFSKIAIGAVMGCLFLVLIIFSFVSFKSLKGIRQNASDEDKLTAEIEKWYKENLTREYLEEQLQSRYTDNREETKYFIRYAAIKGLISSKFMNLDEKYLDFITEETYNYLYED